MRHDGGVVPGWMVIFPMRLLAVSLLTLAAVAASPPSAEAQPRRRGDVLILNVRPRTWLNPGNVIPQGAQVNPPAPSVRPCRI